MNVGTVELTASERHGLLAAKRRRLTLDILARNTASLELEELAAWVAAREDGIDADDEGSVERVAVTLHHNHLPRMSKLGVLDYDPKARRIDPAGIPPDSLRAEY